MSEVRAVIFDLGRVLVDLDLSAGLFGRLVSTSAEAPDDLMRRLVADPIFRDFSSGRLTPAEFHRRVLERTGLDLDYPAFEALWCAVFRPMDGMAAIVDALLPRLPVGLLSDTDPIHWPHLLRFAPWLARIPRPTLSFETGLLKPDPGCYRAAAQNVGQPPHSCLFIDDLQENVDGAERVGMRAWRFEGPAALSERLRRAGLLDEPVA